MNKTQSWLCGNIPNFWNKDMWPSCSSDLNLINFLVWSLLKKEACPKQYKTVKSLKDLQLKRQKIPHYTLCVICNSAKCGHQKFVHKEGHHFE